MNKLLVIPTWSSASRLRGWPLQVSKQPVAGTPQIPATGPSSASVEWLQHLKRHVGVSCGCGQVHLRPDNVLLGCTDPALGEGGAGNCRGHECNTDKLFREPSRTLSATLPLGLASDWNRSLPQSWVCGASDAGAVQLSPFLARAIADIAIRPVGAA